MRMRRLITAALLGVFLLFLLNLASDDELAPGNAPARAPDQEYDYFMAAVDTTQFNSDGSPRYRLQARRYTHYPAPDHALITAPSLVIYREQQAPWHVSARQGRIETDPGRDEQRVELSDNVVIHRVDSAGREINIYTEFLTIYPDSKLVSTDHAVRLETAGGEISSTGLTADLSSNLIKLLANVRGTYE